MFNGLAPAPSMAGLQPADEPAFPFEEASLRHANPAHARSEESGRAAGIRNSALRGERLELGYREIVVPIFRLAHIDCNLQDLAQVKEIAAQWGQIEAALLRIRAAYLERFSASRNGFTLGDVERLCTLVLAVPTYQLMRAQGGLRNDALHPALRSMFHLTEVLRSTAHQMLSVSAGEAALLPESPVTTAEIRAYVQRKGSFQGDHEALIHACLRVLVDGHGQREAASVALDARVQAALADMDAALDYGLYGLQVHAVVSSMWPAMTRAYCRLSNISRAWSEEPSDTVTRLGEYLHAKMNILNNQTHHATQEWRINRERVYADLYEQCALGLGWPVDEELGQRIAPPPSAAHIDVANRVRSILRRNCYSRPPMDDHDAEQLLQCLMNYFLQAQAILALACDIQRNINSLLGRDAPARPLSATDIDVQVLLPGNDARGLPHLLDELESLLGFRAEITRDEIDITDMAPVARADLPAWARQ
jgi:hypothetical protein